MGLLVDPDDNAGVLAYCDAGALRSLQNKLNSWKIKVDDMERKEKDIGDRALAVSKLYTKFPKQERYLSEVAEAINGQPKGLVSYLHGIGADLKRGTQCMWDPANLHNGCRSIPRDCINEQGIQARLLRAEKAVQALVTNERRNHASLVDLPQDRVYKYGSDPVTASAPAACKYKDSKGRTQIRQNCIKSCRREQPGCSQNMEVVLKGLNALQKQAFDSADQGEGEVLAGEAEETQRRCNHETHGPGGRVWTPYPEGFPPGGLNSRCATMTKADWAKIDAGHIMSRDGELGITMEDETMDTLICEGGGQQNCRTVPAERRK